MHDNLERRISTPSSAENTSEPNPREKRINYLRNRKIELLDGKTKARGKLADAIQANIDEIDREIEKFGGDTFLPEAPEKSVQKAAKSPSLGEESAIETARLRFEQEKQGIMPPVPRAEYRRRGIGGTLSDSTKNIRSAAEKVGRIKSKIFETFKKVAEKSPEKPKVSVDQIQKSDIVMPTEPATNLSGQNSENVVGSHEVLAKNSSSSSTEKIQERKTMEVKTPLDESALAALGVELAQGLEDMFRLTAATLIDVTSRVEPMVQDAEKTYRIVLEMVDRSGTNVPEEDIYDIAEAYIERSKAADAIPFTLNLRRG